MIFLVVLPHFAEIIVVPVDFSVSLSRICNTVRAREADYKTLLAIADYFDVSLDYLFGRTDCPDINR